ncbi:MAG TPA: toll/interleukin-1 receptor domain-containing protein [Terrimicrobiaceae bacterium]
MDGLFINYRREDSAPYAGRLYDFLRRRFPSHEVFMDIDAIDPGEDFVDAIDRTLSASRVVIAVIGPAWATAREASGSRRLDNLDDPVVRELSAALTSNARVIPVLVGGASMPRTDNLPTALHPLARRNAIEISDTRFLPDCERLTSAIARVIEPIESTGEPPPVQNRHASPKNRGVGFSTSISLATFKAVLWTAYAVGLLTVLVFALSGRFSGGEMVFINLLLQGLGAWINVMILRGKNWARIAYVALLAMGLPSAFLSFIESGAEIALNFVGIFLSVWAIRIMFTAPVKQIFERR